MDYDKCLENTQKRFDNNSLKLCPRGYCTAKHKFEVYPSAYANGYATQVCKGTQKDFREEQYPDLDYLTKLEKRKNGENLLQRWYKEEWINVCEKGDGPGGYKVCGSGKGIDNREEYPYCRPYKRITKNTPKTVGELTKQQIQNMCSKKRSLKQGIDGKPTRIMLNGGNMSVPIPENVAKDAILGLKLMENGYEGGTQTGWNRAKQLAFDKNIDPRSLADMRTWFARHGPDAKNGGTSYPGYCKWLKDGKPMNSNNKNNYRGAVSWLIWGGDSAYNWLKSNEIRKIIENKFPKRKKSSLKYNLYCS